MAKFKSTQIILLFIAAICAVMLACSPDCAVAKANDAIDFVISTDNGYDWKLLYDGEIALEYSGEWALPPSGGASVLFADKIKEICGQTDSDYNLEFDLPDVAYTVSGALQFEYTEESSGGIVLSGVYAPAISEDITRALQYRSNGGEYAMFDVIEQSGGLAFGRRVDVGTYDVRFAVYERFVFDRREYNVGRYSAPVRCDIIPAEMQAPEAGTISAEYGTDLKNIARSIVSADGEWKLSEVQQSEQFAEDAVLDVKDGGYKIGFDFIPENRNYKTVRGVELSVEIQPREVRIYIANAHSLIGEPLAEDIGYEVTSELVGDDGVEDLGVEVYVDTDGSVAGRFAILARFANANYIPECKNYDNPLLTGGTYTVYASTLEAVAPDGARFIVYIGDGFENLSLRVEIASEGITPDYVEYGKTVYKVTAAYVLIFESADGERVFPDVDMLLNTDIVSEATHILANDVLSEIGTEIPFRSDHAIVYLCTFIDGAKTGGELIAAIIAIAVVAGLAIIGVAAAIISVKLKKERRKRELDFYLDEII